MIDFYKCTACPSYFNNLHDLIDHQENFCENCQNKTTVSPPAIIHSESFIDQLYNTGNLSKTEYEILKVYRRTFDQWKNDSENNDKDDENTKKILESIRLADHHLSQIKDPLNYNWQDIREFFDNLKKYQSQSQNSGEQVQKQNTKGQNNFKKYQCQDPVCLKKKLPPFANAIQLKYHQTLCHDKHSCEFCHKTFSSKASLIGHVRLHESNIREKNIFCSHCGMEFPYQNRAKKDMCEKKCRQNKNMNNSKNVSSFGSSTLINTCNDSTLSLNDISCNNDRSKPYISYCRIKNCKKIFRGKSLATSTASRKKHEEKHGHEDLFVCYYCDKEFKYFGDYQSHIIKCGRARLQPYRCKEVGAIEGIYHIFI